MALELEPTPMCTLTGLPLPILPKKPDEIRALSLSYPSYHLYRPPDEHHHIHPKASPELSSVEGKAMRNSRIQRTPYLLHHHYYHNTFAGPSIPETEEEAFRFTVQAVTGVIPRQAIDFQGKGDWRIVETNIEQYKNIAQSIAIDYHKPIGRFFAEYASKKDIPGIINDASLIDRFLDKRTPNDIRRRIARRMLSDAVTFSLEETQLSDRYKEFKEQGLLGAQKPPTFYSVAKRLVRIGHLDYFQNVVTDRLATA